MSNVFIEPYPFGKRFAISLVDDTDGATLTQIAPGYTLLRDFGIRATKTVWALKATDICGDYPFLPTEGDTLEDREYRDFCRQLHSQGFEIALHTATGGNSTREETIQAYDFFEDIFGHPPFTNMMHSRNKDNIYWGKNSVSNPILSKLISFLEPQEFLGHKRGTKYYWGDICKERTKYVRLFATLQTNTLAFDPATPYHDPKKPDVNWWFSCSFGHKERLFALLTKPNIEKLARQRGASIIHYYIKNYISLNGDGNYLVQPRFKSLVQDLSGYPDGWYVPVVELLDRLRAVRNLQVTINNDGEATISNKSGMDLADLALHTPADITVLNEEGVELRPSRNSFDQINLGNLRNEGLLKLNFSGKIPPIELPQEKAPKEYKLVFGHLVKVLWQFLHGRMSIKPGSSWGNDQVK